MKTAVILAAVSVCALAVGGELQELHRKQTGNKEVPNKKSRSHAEVTFTNHGVTEIGIERTLCYGTCPAYTFVAKSDGTVRYDGEKYVKRIGKFSGNVKEIWRFHQLAQFIKDSSFDELEDSYSLPITDGPTVYTMVVLNGKRKVVSNYSNAGPTKLWAIEELIDKLMTHTQWDKEK